MCLPWLDFSVALGFGEFPVFTFSLEWRSTLWVPVFTAKAYANLAVYFSWNLIKPHSLKSDLHSSDIPDLAL